MNFKDYFTFWDKLKPAHQEKLLNSAVLQRVSKGTIIHDGSADCTGLILVKSGQLRAYILSEEGREISIYRLFDMDLCLFSASCMMRSIQFEITLEAEKDTEFWLMKPELYRSVMEESATLANYTNEIMASRFSEVMWLIEQVMWKSMDKRIAAFLLEESSIESSIVLKITHESIANHLGTHREVVTRILRYLQNENLVKLSRGTITILDQNGLEALGG